MISFTRTVGPIQGNAIKQNRPLNFYCHTKSAIFYNKYDKNSKNQIEERKIRSKIYGDRSSVINVKRCNTSETKRFDGESETCKTP